MDILDDFSALHNLKQREGLNPVTSASVTNYILERHLIRTLENAVAEEDVTIIGQKAKLAPASVIDAVEDYAYRLRTEDLIEATKILETQNIYAALRFMCLEAEYD